MAAAETHVDKPIPPLPKPPTEAEIAASRQDAKSNAAADHADRLTDELVAMFKASWRFHVPIVVVLHLLTLALLAFATYSTSRLHDRLDDEVLPAIAAFNEALGDTDDAEIWTCEWRASKGSRGDPGPHRRPEIAIADLSGNFQMTFTEYEIAVL